MFRALEKLSALEFSYREITKPLRPLGKAASLLLEILRLLCKSVVSENLFRVMCSGFLFPLCILTTYSDTSLLVLWWDGVNGDGW